MAPEPQRRARVPPGSALMRYGAALAAGVLAIWARRLLDPWLGVGTPYITVFAAVILVAWAAGRGPALVTLATGAVGAAYWLLAPRQSLAVAAASDQLGLVLYLALGALMLGIVDRLRVERDRSEARRLALEQESAARRHSEAMFARLADSNVVGIGVGDDQGRITYINDEMLRLMGRDRAAYERGEVNWRAAIAPESADVVQASLEVLQREGRSGTYEKVFVHPDGTRVPFLSAGALLGHDGLHISLALDLTERKQAEDALRRETRRKDEFLATLAHELRNPLAPIRSGLDVLAHAEASDEVRARVVPRMQRQLAHLVRLVDDLLDTSRVTRGHVQLQRRPVALAEVLRSALDSCSAACEAAGHRLALELPDAPLVVDGDETRLAQVFANLLNNAVKFTPPGGRIALHLAREGTQAVVEVRDSGAGIPPERLHEVFDLFVQLDTSLQRQGGLGIGLTLARHLVELHGGTVHAHSAGPGQGSVFTVRLPLLLR